MKYVIYCYYFLLIKCLGTLDKSINKMLDFYIVYLYNFPHLGHFRNGDKYGKNTAKLKIRVFYFNTFGNVIYSCNVKLNF